MLISFTFLAFGCEEPVSIPSTKEEAVLKLETAGYKMTDVSIEEEGVISMITAYKQEENGYSAIMVIWFENETLAKEYEKDWIDSKYEIKKISGSMIYYGTEKAVKDFEKA